MKTKIEGTIVEWTIDNKLVIHIDNYVEANKMDRVKKCNDVQNDTVIIDNHSSFRLIEKEKTTPQHRLKLMRSKW